MERKKTVAVIVILSLLVIFSAVFIKLLRQKRMESQYMEQLELGNRYLTEQNYEEAVMAFSRVIEIDPKQAEGYLKLAEAYSGFGQYDKAATVLKQGFEMTEDEQIKELWLSAESNLARVEETKKGEGEEEEPPDEEAVYKEILDKYYLAVSEHWKRQMLLDEGLCYLCSYYDGLSQIGYCFMDIDGNGVEELLIGETGTDGYKGMFFDLYAIIDNRAVQIAVSGERDRYYLCTGYKIANEGSGGAELSSNTYYEFDGERGMLSLIEAVTYDGDYDENNPWFYSAEGVGREFYTPISQERAFQIQNQYTYTDIPFISFDEYPYSWGIEQRTKDIMTEAVTAIVYYYRGQETLAENLTDTDIQYFLEWHLNNEGYDNGTENKPIFDSYEYDEYGRKWFDIEDVYKKMEDIYGREVNRELISQDILFDFQDGRISMPGGDGDEWLLSTLLECRTEDETVTLRIHYRIEYNVPELNTEETVTATFEENPDSYMGYTLVKVESME